MFPVKSIAFENIKSIYCYFKMYEIGFTEEKSI